MKTRRAFWWAKGWHLGIAGSAVLIAVSAGTAAGATSATIEGSSPDRVLRIEGDGGDQDLVLRPGGGGDGVEVVDGASIVGLFAASDFDRVEVRGNDGDDSLAVEACDIVGHFSGGPGLDKISLSCGGAGVVYRSDTSGEPNSGTFEISNGGRISFEGVEPLVIFGAGGSLLVDVSAAPSSLVVDDDFFHPGAPVPPLAVPPGLAGDGISVIYDPSGLAGFETVQFRGFGDVSIRNGPGTHTIDLIALDTAGLGASLTDIILDGDSSIAPDASDDVIRVQTLPSGVTATLMGGPDGGVVGDAYVLENLISRPRAGEVPATVIPVNSVDGILGPVVVQPAVSPSPAFVAPEEGGLESLTVTDTGDATGDSVVVTATTIDGITGPDVALGPDITYGLGDVVETIALLTSATTADLVAVTSMPGGSTLAVSTGGGDDALTVWASAAGSQVQVNGGSKSDSLTIQAPDNPDTITVNDTQTAVTGLGTVDYAEIESLTMNAGNEAGPNGDQVTATLTGVIASVLLDGQNPAALPGDRLELTGPASYQNFEVVAPASTGEPCVETGDCETGLICFENLCRAGVGDPCTETADCTPGLVCSGNVCWARPVPALSFSGLLACVGILLLVAWLRLKTVVVGTGKRW